MSMEPTVLLALASATSQLARSGGIVTTAADRLTVETPADLKPLVRGDFTVGVRSLEVAARSDRAAERKVALVEAAESFERAEDQDRLPRHLRGFAAGLLAACALRHGDRRAGDMWAERAVKHYDATFRHLHERAARSERILQKGHRWRKHAWIIQPLGGPLVVTTASKELARRTTATLPSPRLIGQVSGHARAVHVLARELGVPVAGRAHGLRLQSHSGIVTHSELRVAAESAHRPGMGAVARLAARPPA